MKPGISKTGRESYRKYHPISRPHWLMGGYPFWVKDMDKEKFNRPAKNKRDPLDPIVFYFLVNEKRYEFLQASDQLEL
jgi:hypothetical protein